MSSLLELAQAKASAKLLDVRSVADLLDWRDSYAADVSRRSPEGGIPLENTTAGRISGDARVAADAQCRFTLPRAARVGRPDDVANNLPSGCECLVDHRNIQEEDTEDPSRSGSTLP